MLKANIGQTPPEFIIVFWTHAVLHCLGLVFKGSIFQGIFEVLAVLQ